MADIGLSIDAPIYIGIWTNWSRGQIAGATLTLTHRNGALLTAFLAIFVTFVGTSFWRIASFIIHQLLSSEAPKDGLYHQTQAILRNSTTGNTGLTHFLRILWAWRRKVKRPFHRMMPLIGAAALSTAAFAVASIFSSRISSAIGDEVLIASKFCGNFYTVSPNVTYSMIESTAFPYLTRKVNSYANYVQNCYANISKADGCGSYVQHRLPSTIDRDASCPFQGNICRHQNRNIRLDTGYLRIDTDLGLNVPPRWQYSFRITDHCAPLIADDHKQIFNYSNDISYMRYFYGRRIQDSVLIPGEDQFTEETQLLPAAQRTWEAHRPMADYQLGSVFLRLH